MKLTEMEITVMDYLIDVGWYNYNLELEYSDVETAKIGEHTEIDMNQLRGVLASLVKKNVIWIAHYNWEHGTDNDEYDKNGQNIVYANRNAYAIRNDLDSWDSYFDRDCGCGSGLKANEWHSNPLYIPPGPQYTVKYVDGTFWGTPLENRIGARPNIDTHFTHRRTCGKCVGV